MPVTVGHRDDNDLKIQTVSDQKIEAVLKTRETLDKTFFENELKEKATTIGLGYVDLYGYPIDTSNLIKISKEEALMYNMGVFNRDKKQLKIATTNYNPAQQKPLVEKLVSEGYNFDFFICSQESFDKLISTYDFVIERKETGGDLLLNPESISKLMHEELTIDTFPAYLASSENASVTDILEHILVVAYKNEASDIHIEPEKTDCTLRLRLDGVLHEFGRFTREVQEKLETRIKLISNLKLNVTNVPQDGRFSFKLDEKQIDMRVSLLPSNYGYSIVIRLLGTGTVSLDLDALGFEGLAKQRLEKEMSVPQGMILSTGPTGSGKTTTLYTILNKLNDGAGKIITLEDPVEYKLAGISQTQIDTKAGYTFASGLRSILRQDPDIVMVGEIRDSETAQTAIDAALTGHKVLSTLHTNDAIGAVPRLLELDVKGYAIGDGISLIIGQRLVRKLCTHCKARTNLSQEDKEFVLSNLQSIPANSGLEIPQNLDFYKPVGCAECNFIGYKGRVGVYEVLTMTDSVKELLLQENPSFVDLRARAVADGMVTLLQDAVYKATKGLTDLGEIHRTVA
jgi:type IV pilus assembly protein PilB